MQIPGLPGTAWDLFGLAAHISGPTGVTRDCHDPLSHSRDVIEPTFLVPEKRISDLPPD